jgi:predicted nucleotidyltransferase
MINQHHKRTSNEGDAMTTSNKVITLAEVRAKREEILRTAAKRGARRVRIFGSVTRDDARVHSDIDFLVDFEADRDVADLSELTIDLEEILDRDVHVVDVASLNRMRDRVTKDATPL